MTVVGCSDMAKVEGTAVKKDGTPLIGARVIARSKESGTVIKGTTDANGHFQLESEKTGAKIEPGDYEVVISENRGDMNMQPPTVSLRYQNSNESGLDFSVAPKESKTLAWTLDAPER